MKSIKHFLVIRSAPEIIYKALTEQSGLASWWTKETIAEAKIGATIEFIFGDKYHDKMVVTNLNKNKSVEWECTVGDKEWIGTKFKFDLENREKDTILRFSHYNWKEETDFFANCNYHWGYYLRSLKLFCETGKGTPFVNE
jgi:uncharacterized protein YndB with AHSA1/START domain